MDGRTSRRRLAAAAAAGIGIAAAASPAQADRGYELVTPQGQSPQVRLGGGAATPDGQVVCFNTEAAIAGATPNGLVTADDGFCARRRPDGWQTTWVTGPTSREITGARGGQIYFVAPDGERVVFASDGGLFPDFTTNGPGSNSYATLSAHMREGESLRWLAPTPQPLREQRQSGSPADGIEREPLAASDDLRHGIFLSNLALVPQDANDAVDVYEWTPDGIRLVTRDETGAAVGGFPAFGPARDVEQTAAEPGSVSPDGSRIFFERAGSALAGAPADVRSVFMRAGDTLRHVSPRRGPGPAQDVAFAGSYDDGRVVHLLTEEQLTDEPKESGLALYEYDVETDELALLASADAGVSYLGASADASTVVYRTSDLRLRVLRNGTETELGTVSFLDTITAFDSVASARSDKRALRISPDGSAIAFASAGDFDAPGNGTMQVYRWQEGVGVRRISRSADGSDPVTDAWIGNFTTGMIRPRQAIFNTMRGRPSVGRVLTDDGSRVFFETADPLVAADVNGFVDVYEWRDGAVSLVTPGTQAADALYHDSSADGSTVFFATDARVVPQADRNSGRDLYAAQEGDVIPPPQPPAPCAGDACQPPVTPPQPPPAPRTGSFTGPGDVDEPRPPAARHTVAKLGPRARRAFARTGRTVLRVRMTRGGTVTATGTARVGRRSVRVARSARRGRDGATVRVPLRLSRAARAALRARGRLRVTIAVTYSQTGGSSRQVVVLRVR